MTDDASTDHIAKLQRQLRRRILELQNLNADCQNYALDRVIHERMDTYFRLEERLEELNTLCLRLADEIDAVDGLTALRQIDGRLNFLEECFDDVESEMRDRPRRRRRRRFNVADFFRQWREGGDGATTGLDEIGSASEAYHALGVATDSDRRTIMRAFRRLVKDLHPDARGGDRSTEPRLRQIVAAYDFLKRHNP